MTRETELFGEAKGDRVVIAEADPRWTDLFEYYKSKLASALGSTAIRIDHVGSTAIAGLPAKPVIDIQVSVNDVTDEDRYRSAIESLGWPLRARESDHRFFRPPASEERSVHVHVCSAGSDWERRHLLFVAYLSANPEHAAQYAELKRELAQRFGRNRVAYTNAKDDFIVETLRLADDWAARTSWLP
jgi:GrpB-like predicted nucleotidyltransferase (UPF0157 family)